MQNNEIIPFRFPLSDCTLYVNLLSRCGLPDRGSAKKNIRLAVNSVERNLFHRKAPAYFSVECGDFFVRFSVFRDEIFFTAFTGFLIKNKLPYMA